MKQKLITNEEESEIRHYDIAVASLVAAARERFIINLKKGKSGWDDYKNWEYEDEPLIRAMEEIFEAKNKILYRRKLELGDAMNFLVFDYVINGGDQ